MKVKRVDPNTVWSRLYLPSIFSGMGLTFRHIFRRKDTVSYPEERHEIGEGYRGVPALVKDQDGRPKCVSCYMCQFVCPPKAITIEAEEYPPEDRLHQVEKRPRRFEINMLRCIYCGLCEEVCPEEAIFMSGTYAVVGHSRELMVFDKERLYQIGGERKDDVLKWSESTKGSASRSHLAGEDLVAR